MQSHDPKLDADLQAVPLPDGLLDRLRAVALADDEGVDEALRDVPVPRGLLKRLRQIPLADDEGLDEALRDVRVPTRLGASWKRRAGKQDRMLRLGRMMVAASVIAVLTLSYIAATLMSVPETAPTAVRRAPAQPKEAERFELSWDAQSTNSGLDWAPPPLGVAVGQDRVEPRRRIPDGLADFSMPADSDPLAIPAPRVYGIDRYDTEEDLFKRVTGFRPRGMEWPVVQGSNTAFLSLHRVHPFVSPAADPQLQSCIVPLDADTNSYELARRYLEGGIKGKGRAKGKEGEWPPSSEVRAEEFINAPDYEYPQPSQHALGLTITAGPSPFRGEGYCLVQVGVQARQLPELKRPPVHLIVLVDSSGSMQWGGRVAIVQRALRDLIKHVDPADRLSLLSFSGRANLLVEDIGPSQVGHFLAAVDWLSAEGPTNAAAGLNEAYAVAEEETGPQRAAVRVVLLTDGLLELGTDPRLTEAIHSRARDAATRGIPLHVIDLGQGKDADRDLAALARTAEGTVHRATTTEQVRWALQEVLTGQSQLVARDAQLRVTFNPKAVLEYRLLGHELGIGGPASARADFRDGQSATALFELRVAPRASGNVATAELNWYSSDEKRRLERNVRGIAVKEFASSFETSAPSLQQAALMAQAAEVFRNSVFARQTRGGTAPMVLLQQLAHQVDSRLYHRSSFIEFLTMLELATKPTRPGAPGSRR